jgi:hypothetical protein
MRASRALGQEPAGESRVANKRRVAGIVRRDARKSGLDEANPASGQTDAAGLNTDVWRVRQAESMLIFDKRSPCVASPGRTVQRAFAARDALRSTLNNI